jgi:hypothetical protein
VAIAIEMCVCEIPRIPVADLELTPLKCTWPSFSGLGDIIFIW